ncbi:MAG: hypothetical protein ACTHP8_18275 [Bosea sp. (in: a-proteobacteria)]|uniref:hypothetical protein n=1 Tax=Bosea sp. (in: a-proteobacteria) TaxID=1871050 RepID=UPI003F7B86F8
MSHRDHGTSRAVEEHASPAALPHWQRLLDEHWRTVLLAAAWIVAIIIVRLS